MAEHAAKEKIIALRKRWVRSLLLFDMLTAAGLSLLIGSVLAAITQISLWWTVVLFPVLFAIFIFLRKSWLITVMDMAKYLNEKYPALEESATLAMKPAADMNLLERLQHARMQEHLLNISPPGQPKRNIVQSFAFLLLCVVMSALIFRIPPAYLRAPKPYPAAQLIAAPPQHETLLPRITSVNVTIIPPAYTRKTTRKQNQFNMVAEETSLVSWQIKTSVPVKELFLIFNDSASLRIQPVDKTHMSWLVNKKINSSAFYQLREGAELSEYYKLEMIKDQPPTVHIDKPAQYTTVGSRGSQTITLIAGISDDYGMNDAYITATIANGSGEAVKFRDQKLNFSDFHAGYRNYQLQKLLSPASLGMQPGDELYYYIVATDNFNQQSRSDVYILKLQDTASTSTVEGLSYSLAIKPEYFRSERQIIMETEQLIKSKMHPADEAFRNKSNDLGIDQKLLRLRYGKFLGEEAESGIPGAEGNESLANPENFGNGQKVLDQYTDKHDNAEDAGFFEPEIKKKLKATLTEMWKAELQLRVFKPHEALVYEYKALRLLKDLQQQSRAYVAKTSFATPPVKPEKRLTGDLDKIIEPHSRQDYHSPADPTANIPAAMGILSQIKINEPLSHSDFFVLEQAQQQLNKMAASMPAVYLSGAQEMRKIMDALRNNKFPSGAKLSVVEVAFQKIVTEPERIPAPVQNTAATELSQQYFKNTKRLQAKP